MTAAEAQILRKDKVVFSRYLADGELSFLRQKPQVMLFMYWGYNWSSDSRPNYEEMLHESGKVGLVQLMAYSDILFRNVAQLCGFDRRSYVLPHDTTQKLNMVINFAEENDTKRRNVQSLLKRFLEEPDVAPAFWAIASLCLDSCWIEYSEDSDDSEGSIEHIEYRLMSSGLRCMVVAARALLMMAHGYFQEAYDLANGFYKNYAAALRAEDTIGSATSNPMSGMIMGPKGYVPKTLTRDDVLVSVASAWPAARAVSAQAPKPKRPKNTTFTKAKLKK